MSDLRKRLVGRAERELKLLKLGFKNLLIEVCEKVNESNTVSEIEESIDEVYDYLDALKDSERRLNYHVQQLGKGEE
ncbi:MAG: hypothetical protein IKA85_06875 [Clostridia bacterium]|nr:hypothetical protein [Clostridia bacterium]